MARLKAKGSSSAAVHASASEHALWNAQKQQELKEAHEESKRATHEAIMDRANNALAKSKETNVNAEFLATHQT